ncbi:Cellobiose 2-epimerase [Thalassoglobus neptunius]|uniref:Cellobiose 2-epimerase n=1 Tax=Thalassoglobus neptunius TaxID=1938619 RepID=A0A5C5X651_9PLAN|nr:DUF255 domain-containing protein [Thalassoglobus neptunius]TWT58119.1 Cellobiose 2-epimerase [Thalassoglobus neptunius]
MLTHLLRRYSPSLRRSSPRSYGWGSVLAVLLVFTTSCGTRIGAESADSPADEQENAKAGKRHQNRLIHESSPYLLLHAHNPVDWYPWGPEAFNKARAQNKPIFLSIGYSSCFWCHVMERKVFENEEIAAYMNEHFINIKVDREERPDVDEIYMLALQVYLQMAGSSQGGGWPLSMFLTPNGDPIAGGTYFPPEDMPGRPGFPSVMEQLTQIWETRQPDVLRTASVISQEVRRLSNPQQETRGMVLNQQSVNEAIRSVVAAYDPEYGGFDFNPGAPDRPKFPVPSKLLLVQSYVAKNASSADTLGKQLRHTLDSMAQGGIYDHLGGGFYRYSTERKWLVPHFEKMLYDNAQLVEAYTNEYERTHREQDRVIAEETLDFVLREMTDPKGGFYSALDAETDGIEGKHYVWSLDEIKSVLSPSDYPIFATAYGLQEEQVFEHGVILHRPASTAEVAREFSIPKVEMAKRLQLMREQLLAVRSQREPLLRDDKILTSWNGLMIRAFARAGMVFQREDYVKAAERAATDVLTRSRDREGRLLRTPFRNGSPLPAYLDDYAFLSSGLLALYQATDSSRWLNTARRLTDTQQSLFWDVRDGGYFFTAHDHESLIARTKSAYDSALPSGNSVSVRNLLQLYHITQDRKYLDLAQRTLAAFASQFSQSPGSLAFLAIGLDEYLQVDGPISIESDSVDRTRQTEPEMPPKSTPEKPSSEKPSPEKPMEPAATESASSMLIAGLTADVSQAQNHPRIEAVGLFGRTQAARGSNCPVAVVIQIAPGWHVNANPARPKFIIPTTLSVASPEGFELTDIVYPQGKDFQLEGIDEALSVYEGSAIILGELMIPQDAAENVSISLNLRYQACDSQTCEMPLTMTLSGKLIVGDTPGEAINSRIFSMGENGGR